MRIRSTKPEFWRSERIASVDWDVRLVLKGLESYVDDNGVGKDDVALIVGDVFPRDMVANPRETVARVSEAICTLHLAGLLWRYEANSTRLLYISWWEDIQRIDRPGKGRFPRPDGTLDYKESVIRECVASPREGVATGTGEQGSRGTGEQTTTREPDWDEPPPPAPIDVVGEPAYIETSTKPAKRHASSGAKTLVRQTLGNDYPRQTVERLAIQVDKLAQAGHRDNVIRDALTEWERRPNCDKPEFLPTVLGDVVKRSRTNGLTPGESKVAGWAALGQPNTTPNLKAINE